MPTILEPPAEQRDAFATFVDVGPRCRDRLAGDSRRGLESCLASGVMHVLAFGCLTYYASDISAIALPVHQGRASVALVASAPAVSRYVPEAEMEIVPEEPEEPLYEPEQVDVIEAAHTDEQRVQPDVVVPPEPPMEVILEEAEIVVQLPPRQEEQEPQPEISKMPPPIKRTTPAEALAKPNPLAEGLDSIDSLASIASQARDGAEVDTPPSQMPSNPAPPYPSDALQAGLEGRVVLRVVVATNGTAEEVSVDQSSGAPSLDASALATVRRWRFLPARRAGAAVRSVVKVPVRFSIRNALRG